MSTPRIALLLSLGLAACGVRSVAGTQPGVPDYGWVDTATPDFGPGVDPGEDFPEPDAPVMTATCATPIAVWGGKAIGKALPTTGLNFETRTGAPTAVTAPSCGTAGPQGEVVFRLVVDSPVTAITNVETQVAGMTPTVSYVRESCAGTEVDCIAAADAAQTAELATALQAGTYIVIVRFASRDGGDPSGIVVDLSFDFTPGEICNDGIDNNQDGNTDCDDPTCFTDPHCTGGASGDDCSDPFLINGGKPPKPGFAFKASNTLAGRKDDYQAPAPCWPGSAGSGDAVWRVALDQEMSLEIAVVFYDGTFGHAYVMDATCSSLAGCIPANFTGDPSLLVTLPKGTWHVVVDRGTPPPTDPDFELDITFDTP